jgi:hypothetical protein
VRLLVIKPAFSQRSNVRLDTPSFFAALAAVNTPETEWEGGVALLVATRGERLAKASVEIRWVPYESIEALSFFAVIQR